MSAAPPSACTVGLQTDGPVSIVTLQRPERLNAINADLLRDLNAQLQTAQADAATRAIVLTGAGRAFCAGDDLKAFDDQSATPASMAQMCEDVQRIDDWRARRVERWHNDEWRHHVDQIMAKAQRR